MLPNNDLLPASVFYGCILPYIRTEEHRQVWLQQLEQFQQLLKMQLQLYQLHGIHHPNSFVECKRMVQQLEFYQADLREHEIGR